MPPVRQEICRRRTTGPKSWSGNYRPKEVWCSILEKKSSIFTPGLTGMEVVFERERKHFGREVEDKRMKVWCRPRHVSI